ncbi:hypothetical protein AB0G60_00095 [Streptomyces angustmyceticus]|uniref:Uncharacterized protein n=1 Tax=Streptomyces angustmyceticus TaxID=285578 RepID=A0A5J4L8A8_9ACTN|nr:hypothetical protein [Streptomyces angustmyceticus]UAL65121.1 hypothetical protein K7396_00125 [Streptomyces angustmyceticus]GES28442.1 hypothetical protein San01_09290 [Streptomyces angustmyceticus]
MLDSDLLWRRCAHLGRVLLPLVDQEPGRQADRHENLRTWGITTVAGERLIEVFASLAVHAVATDASMPATELDALPLRTVADAATGKRDFELLAGLPHTFTDDHDEQAVSLFRLSVYEGGHAARKLFQLSREVRHALIVLAEHTPMSCHTCGDAFRRAAAFGLPQ